MEEEIRVYFECFEQANHFILPSLIKTTEAAGINSPVKLVKLKGNYKYYSKKIAPIIYWKDPDILISIVKENEETPLLMVEFSNAVYTEDHELQRFDGLVAAAENNCVYVKISPLEKESLSEHGGNVKFDYVKPYALIFDKYGHIFFHFNWPIEKRGVVKVKENYLSCPPSIKGFENVLTYIFKAIKTEGGEKWIEKFYEMLYEDDEFEKWISLLKNYDFQDIGSVNTTRTRWVNEDDFFGKNFLEIKINRFGHAMDPERGMLAFYGTMLNKVIAKMRFVEDNDAWYKDIPAEEKIRGYIKKNGLKKGYDFLKCFMLGSGLFKNKDFKEMVENYKDDSSVTLVIDLTEFIKKNFGMLNKPLRTIIKFSKAFYIENYKGEKRVIFYWDKIDIKESFEENPDITLVTKLKELDEDLVTYITIHNILRPNGFKILAASYPGAQADRVILVEYGKGRAQKRRYIDIISYLPEKEVTALQENKGKFTPSGIQKDIEEISKFKTDESYKKGLRMFQEKFEPDSLDSTIKIGIGFWSNPNFKISKLKDLDLKELDYFIYITPDKKKWYIWRTGNENIFSNSSGEVKIPTIYEVVEKKTQQKSLF